MNATGSDSNSGTSVSAPFKTIGKAAGLVTAGSVVHVAPGTYVEVVSVNRGGTSNAPVRFVSDIPWQAKVQGTGTSGVWAVRADWVSVEGFDVFGDANAYFGIVLYGNNQTAKGNHVHNIPSPVCSGAGGAGILSGGAGGAYDQGHNIISENVVHDIGPYPAACQTTQGIYYATSGGVTITNNLVYRVTGYGIHLWHAAANAIITNNTVFNCLQSGLVVGNGDSPGGTSADFITVNNNIFMNNSDRGMSQSGIVGTHNTYTDNLVYGNPNPNNVTGMISGTITVDPQFVNYKADGTGDCHLQGTSPAIDKGTSQDAPVIDLDHIVRPQGSADDIGAYEYKPAGSVCDVNNDKATNVADVQLEVNQSLGNTPCTADINNDGHCTVLDVQRVVNAALGGACVSP